ncbi:glycoside hydrolase family 95 protein [Rhizoctonia solani AG-1 IA]|uniref:Glycoside hydrolase family 95 protein n=1 Tax=Thanatephorus cucumeris (strain AG1-IA) TaxID=983506 RepID=L8WMQ9_THACA|nr:glycoside hydrolase family 95 protein [Rhizoctonia solani AG-1 IA]
MSLLIQALCMLRLGTMVLAMPPGFPTSGNGLWYSEPAVNWSTQYLPIGNGYLAAAISGNPASDRIQLNIESLWSGGYNGGNHQPSEQRYLAAQVSRIRNGIFIAFGTYSGAGYLHVNRTISGEFTRYSRWLDMDNGVLKTIWTELDNSFIRQDLQTYFCSNPTRACTVHTASSAPGAFSATFSFSSLDGLPTRNITCLDTSTIQLRGYAASPGMLYEILASIRHAGPAGSSAACVVDGKSGDAVLVTKGSTEAWVSWVGGTEYSMETGNAQSRYTFKGADPHGELVGLLANAEKESVGKGLANHIGDYRAALGGFSLDIGQKVEKTKTTAELRKEYKTDIGNPGSYLEWLLFNYGRYMLVSSTRGDLPANLQGKWARDTANPWFGINSNQSRLLPEPNINLQMNYWSAEMTGLNVTSTLWDYMEVERKPGFLAALKRPGYYTTPRADGLFIMRFGSDNSAEWANYPEAAAWMVRTSQPSLKYMAHGWPILKGVATFWLDHLVKDEYFKDGTLVAVPCNSPEQAITTLEETQDVLILSRSSGSCSMLSKRGSTFQIGTNITNQLITEIREKRLKLDKGIKIGSFGQLQEWKVEFDSPTNLHRHLSHLVGLYPGYTLANFRTRSGAGQGIPELSREQVLKASEISLISRGNGTGPDGDAGWEKIWRAACWAQLKNNTRFYHHITYAIERNFAENLWSLYNSFTEDPIFQIDANLGYPAAVLNALVQAPDTPSLFDALAITILPALPDSWASGSIKGARIRGGMALDLTWSNGKAVRATIKVDTALWYARKVQLWQGGQLVATFSATPGLRHVPCISPQNIPSHMQMYGEPHTAKCNYGRIFIKHLPALSKTEFMVRRDVEAQLFVRGECTLLGSAIIQDPDPSISWPLINHPFRLGYELSIVAYKHLIFWALLVVSHMFIW